MSVALLLASMVFLAFGSSARAQDPCGAGSNPIVCENSKPGTPSSEWDILENGDLSIQGFATDMSVNVGGTIGFKIDTDATDYSLLIYRMGWYGGDGARLVDTVQPSATLPQVQPDCLVEVETDLTDCGNWGLSASWQVPPDAVSGVYIARPLRADTGGDSHILFIVRDDDRPSDVLFQTSDTTWQAYNNYGASLYFGVNQDRAYKVSYNRPFVVRGGTPEGRDSFFGSEYAMIRWIERNGYDVSYVSGIDTDRLGASSLLDHQVFLSVGHDEYWSAAQRSHVEAARDAGVNLIFASGNEVYWKTRWEPSIDGSNTEYRTLVSYKETLANAKIDPSPEWTGTWRDPRFSPPSDGGRPENALTGTLFTVNCCTYSLKVPAEYGDLRFWRNTSVASLASGSEKTFPFGTLGYEWDEDIDNGFRPAGAFRMSRTTEVVDQRLIDFGSTVAREEATHHLMMYRAASGALVFGAGTVQWSWGLDDYHDGQVEPVDPDMQQATVNVLADMGVQPQTLENGLVAASASTDTTAPVTTLASPAAGQTFGHGDAIVVTGTASDGGGGVVAAVEVSVDGGASWHPAEGRESWSYTTSIMTRGTETVLARAVDDSGNLGPSVSVAVEVDCPCQIFGDDETPKVASFADTTQLELGVKFQTAIDGWITGVRFYKGPANTGTHVGSLWTAAGELLASGTFANETAEGWQDLTFSVPVPVVAGTTYVASYNAPNGGYAGDTGWFAVGPTVSPPLSAIGNTQAEPNGVFAVGPAQTFPTNSFQGSNYWVDVVFSLDQPPDERAPEIVATSPLAGASSVPSDTAVAIVADESLDAASIVFSLRDANDNPIAGSLSYDDASRTISFSPTSSLAAGTQFSVSATFNDAAGNAVAAPVQFSFATAQPDGAVAALWDDSTQPPIVDSGDGNSVEVGVKFVPEEDLDITGIRFYKAETNTGPHTGSLWDSSGALLAQAAFSQVSTTGWQQVTFAEPVRVTRGTQYVASYFTASGHYSASSNFFEVEYASGPLTAPASDVVGGNGVYAYASSSTFPTSSAGNTNYWVSPVYDRLPDTSAPVVVATTPADRAASVALDEAITVTFDEPLDPSSLTLVLRDDAGSDVAGSLAYDASTLTATFSPSAVLSAGTPYTVQIAAADAGGNATNSPFELAFTTVSASPVPGLWDDTAVPTLVDSQDVGSIEVGVKFVPETDLEITGVRFYKALGNTGPHLGSLWDAAGNRLAQATFADTVSSGWHQVSFDSPIPVLEGETYVASYFAPNGRYSATAGFFDTPHSGGLLLAPASDASGGNGVYAYAESSTFPTSSFNGTNYWVTPVYDVPPDLSAPIVASTDPLDGESSVLVDATPSVRFDEAVDAGSLALALRDAAEVLQPGTVSYDADTFTATFVPDAPLSADEDYRLSVSATDIAGNAMAAPVVISFATATETAVPALWSDATRPDTIDSGDANAIEVGVKFVPSVDLDITGVRFYKSAANTGPHSGSLWDATGVLLANVAFGAGTTAGWQEALFATPVRVVAGQTYVISYFAPNGHYSATNGFFGAPYTAGPIVVPAASSSGGNGVYAYSATSTFPEASSDNTNYWVSPLYALPSDSTAPTVVATSPLDGASSVSVNTSVAVEVDEPIDTASIVFEVTETGGTAVTGSISYDAENSIIRFDPQAALTSDTTYDVSVSFADTTGNPVVAPAGFSFTTAASNGSIAALWEDSTVPDTSDSGDVNSIEVGVKFVADTDIEVTGVRFFKAQTNTGTHTGSLWSASGNLLARLTFQNETTSGWQEATFAEPVRIIAGQTYVVSYFAPNGHYSVTGGFFETAYDNPPLTAPASDSVGGNGVFLYSAESGFPDSSFNSSNYWVSPTFQEVTSEPPSGTPAIGLWDDATTPDIVDSLDNASIELGTKFVVSADTPILGVRFYKSADNAGPHIGSLWASDGTLLARATFASESGSGWQEVRFSAPYPAVVGETYVVSYFAPNGRYSASSGYFATGFSNGPVSAPASTDVGGNGVFTYGAAAAFPSSSFDDTNYWVSPLY